MNALSPADVSHPNELEGELTLADELKRLERNVYSQNGEDGIIEWVFRRVAPRHRICVEFGAWDGRNLSNTFNLIAHRGWKAVYIEADPKKFQALQKTAANYPTITPVCSLVTATGESSLDRILERQGIPEDFDLLSIDIDGGDYDVWEATVRHRPTLVVIEHNATFPPGVDHIDRRGLGFIGSSTTSLAALASRKGYALLGCTATNSFFLLESCFSALGVKPQTVEQALGREPMCYVLINHAGEFVFSNGAVAAQLKAVTYARPLKSWVRRALRLPTFYVLGEAHREGGAVLRFLRWIMLSVRG
jgi:hypothetical protein